MRLSEEAEDAQLLHGNEGVRRLRYAYAGLLKPDGAPARLELMRRIAGPGERKIKKRKGRRLHFTGAALLKGASFLDRGERICHGPAPRITGRGEVPEWSNGAVSKTVVLARGPRVRIPLSPPFSLRAEENLIAEHALAHTSGDETPVAQPLFK